MSRKGTRTPDFDECQPICNAGINVIKAFRDTTVSWEGTRAPDLQRRHQCHKVQFRATLCKGGFAATCKVFVPISSMHISSLQIVTNFLGNGVNIKHGRIFLANGDRLFGSVINCMFFAANQCSARCKVSIPTSWLHASYYPCKFLLFTLEILDSDFLGAKSY